MNHSTDQRGANGSGGKDQPQVWNGQVTDDRTQIAPVVDGLLQRLKQADYSEGACYAVRLAIEEAISNAFRHGHQDLADDVPIDIEYEVTQQSVRMRVTDQGPGFSPQQVPDPTLDENLEVPSGRGIYLIRAYMASVSYNDAGNSIEMVYHKPE